MAHHICTQLAKDCTREGVLYHSSDLVDIARGAVSTSYPRSIHVCEDDVSISIREVVPFIAKLFLVAVRRRCALGEDVLPTGVQKCFLPLTLDFQYAISSSLRRVS